MSNRRMILFFIFVSILGGTFYYLLEGGQKGAVNSPKALQAASSTQIAINPPPQITPQNQNQNPMITSPQASTQNPLRNSSNVGQYSNVQKIQKNSHRSDEAAPPSSIPTSEASSRSPQISRQYMQSIGMKNSRGENSFQGLPNSGEVTPVTTINGEMN